ncbi:hypothetical protein LOZ80_18640 [Paenibacillus sp. HWE-109]|uniref:hypothetical protein n=1 Tax=Paenibacillus sp. HWE-109 TaxID=1306526 RepID=UPI001EE10F99|nr:hypothetical protein [Paenibacillus sp. HWE-109]UKS30843.1 hypothetical protein LOZ80_18640 [Paenibacillus sp. HWE-109]
MIRSIDPDGNNTLRKGKKSGLPIYLRPMMKLFFPPPTKGASLLYNGAFGKNKEVSGDFFVKNQATPLRFLDKGQKVLELVNSIYGRDFPENLE